MYEKNSIAEAYLKMYAEAVKVEAEDEDDTPVDETDKTEKAAKGDTSKKKDPAAIKPKDDEKDMKESVDENELEIIAMKLGVQVADLLKFLDVHGQFNEEVELDEAFTDKQIKMAYGILNDKRYKGGDLTHAVRAIEKIAKGLSDHPGVQRAMKATNENEEVAEAKMSPSDMKKAREVKKMYAADEPMGAAAGMKLKAAAKDLERKYGKGWSKMVEEAELDEATHTNADIDARIKKRELRQKHQANKLAAKKATSNHKFAWKKGELPEETELEEDMEMPYEAWNNAKKIGVTYWPKKGTISVTNSSGANLSPGNLMSHMNISPAQAKSKVVLAIKSSKSESQMVSNLAKLTGQGWESLTESVGYAKSMGENVNEAKEVTPKDVEDHLVKTGVNPKDAKEAVKKGFGYANKKYGGPTHKAAVKKIAEVVWSLHEEVELEEAKMSVDTKIRKAAEKMTRDLKKKGKSDVEVKKALAIHFPSLSEENDKRIKESTELDEATYTPEKILGSKPSQIIKSKDQWVKAAKGMKLVVKSPSTTPEGDNNKDVYLTAFDKQGNMKGTWYKTHGVFKESVELNERKQKMSSGDDIKVGDRVLDSNNDNAPLEVISVKKAKSSPGYEIVAKDSKGKSKKIYVDYQTQIELDEAKAKTHPAYDELMKLAKKMNNRDTRLVQELAGKLSKYTVTGDRGLLSDMAKAFKFADDQTQEDMMAIIMKRDPAMGRSIMKSLKVNEALEKDGPKRPSLDRFRMAKGEKGSEYQKKKAQQRQDMNKKNDPGAAKKGLAISVLDKAKARAKATKKGLEKKISPYDMAVGQKPNKMMMIQKGLANEGRYSDWEECSDSPNGKHDYSYGECNYCGKYADDHSHSNKAKKKGMRREEVEESLRSDIAKLSAKFPEGSKVKMKHNGKVATVLSVGKDFIKVGVDNKTMDHKPDELVPVKESYVEESSIKGTILRSLIDTLKGKKDE